MNFRSSAGAIWLRSLARRLGLTRVVARLISSGRYEAAFDDALFATLRPGDIVWDVGANVGLYTVRFAASVGDAGQVFAFEPVPSTREELRRQTGSLSNVTIVPVALGNRNAVVDMRAGGDEKGATSRIVESVGASALTAEMSTADRLFADGGARAPNVVKIDTEGFELEVLEGMTNLLAGPSMRAIFVEVHFGILAERGLANAPATIEALLSSAGFATKWVDMSHIAAVRE